MPDIEPVESGDKGVSVWTLLAVAVGALVLVAAAGWLLTQNLSEDGAEATPSTVTSPTPTAPSSTVPAVPTIEGLVTLETSFDSKTAVLFRPGAELVEGTPCVGIDSDVEPGTRITVTDSDGTLIGTGELGEGSLVLERNVEDYTVPRGSSSQRKESVYAAADCVLGFAIPLSDEAEFYTIAIGTLGGESYIHLETYSHVELASFGWILELTP